MSDRITDSFRYSEIHKKLGGPAYCDKCGKYHPVLPFCPETKIPKNIKKLCTICMHVDKSSLAEICLDCYNFSNWSLRQDGKKGRPQALINIQVGDSQVLIIKSGWAGMYHAITENPAEGDLFHEHEFLSDQEVCLVFGIAPSMLNQLED